MFKFRKKFVLIFAILISTLLLSTTLRGHPLGTRLWGHKMVVIPHADFIQLDYTIEVPMTKLVMMMNTYKSQKEISRMTKDDETSFNEEMNAYLQKGIIVKVDNAVVQTIWNPNYAKDIGNGDIGFFEYRLHLIAPLSKKDLSGKKVEVINDNYPIQRAVFYDEIRHSLNAYATETNIKPDTGWTRDEAARKIRFTLNIGKKGDLAVNGYGNTFENKGYGTSIIAHLKESNITPKVFLIAIITAIFLGALHALSPGHGKALVAAYLVGSSGTVAHAFTLGAIVTLTHISSVIILGVVGLLLANYILPEYYAPFISLASGLMIVAIGVWLFIRRFIHRHSHSHTKPQSGPPSARQLITLGISGGIVPCPSAMAIMLTAIAIGRITFGLALICFFSLGLAAVLISIGILTVKTSSLLERFSKFDRITKILPIVSAAIVTLLGIFIIYQGFWSQWMAVK